MIDLHDLRERPQEYQEACRKKGIQFDIAAFVALDKEYRALKEEVESLRAKQNKFSKELANFSGDEKQAKLAEMKQFSEDLKQKTQHFRDFEERWERDQLFIPSVPLAVVPEGKDSEENVEIRTWGALPEFTFTPKDHVQLGEALDLFDIERGVKVAGARNYFLKGNGARLQHAILSLAMDFMHEKGYTLFDPPHIVKYRSMMGTSYFPTGEDQAYHLDERDDEFYLIGTSEVPVCSYYTDEIVAEDSLPIRMAGYSPCYRREAGTYGKDTQGLFRLHQFYKVEQVIICRNDVDESAALHAELLANSEELMHLLELPYRVVDVCTGDMGQGQVYKNDIEAWMPSRNAYCETHSCSTFYDFQARRLAIRFKDQAGKNQYCHTLNNTCVASPRILIPFLEVHQREDGSVRIPEALQPYLRGLDQLSAG